MPLLARKNTVGIGILITKEEMKTMRGRLVVAVAVAAEKELGVEIDLRIKGTDDEIGLIVARGIGDGIDLVVEKSVVDGIDHVVETGTDGRADLAVGKNTGGGIDLIVGRDDD